MLPTSYNLVPKGLPAGMGVPGFGGDLSGNQPNAYQQSIGITGFDPSGSPMWAAGRAPGQAGYYDPTALTGGPNAVASPSNPFLGSYSPSQYAASPQPSGNSSPLMSAMAGRNTNVPWAGNAGALGAPGTSIAPNANQNPLPTNSIFPSNPSMQPPMGSQQMPDPLMASVLSGGLPTNVLPAWQSMVAAQNNQLQEGASNLMEQFGGMGSPMSSAAAQGQADYWNQAILGQNSLLGQMNLQSTSDAMNRLQSSLGQLSGQGFQSQMDQYNLAAQMAQLLQGNMSQAAQGLYGGQMSSLSPFLNYGTSLAGMGVSGNANLGDIINQTWATGGQLGAQQYQMQQQQLNNAYQNWLYQQPQNNPLLQYMYGAATGYPTMVQPGYQPGMLGSLMGGLGSILGGLGLMGGTAGISGI